MQNAETVLEIIRSRGSKGLPLEEVYRQLFNPDLYLRAYGRLYRNAGAMTRGVTAETVDGMSEAKIASIIDRIRHERYRWTPARREYIPKANGKMRPLGIPVWSDKLLQEVMRSILEAYYEPQFSENSHGFRPQHGCHTALAAIQHAWHGTKWFIEGDIKGCFDNIDHEVLLSVLREKIRDNRFLILVSNLLKAGYLEDWRYKQTHSGTPQGGVISPILANIHLDRLDKFVEGTLIPEFTRGKVRKANPVYTRLFYRIRKLEKEGMADAARELRKELRSYPTGDQHDPDYRRLRYVRYADDFLLGFIGPKEEAEAIKVRLKTFLSDHLKLELSEEKTLITHASERAGFLGYEVMIRQSDERPQLNGTLELRLPSKVLDKVCTRYMREGKPTHRTELIHDSDFDIVNRYGAEYRGIVQYYVLAHNVRWLGRLRWYMGSSLLRTLARKHNTTTTKMARLYEKRRVSPSGTMMKCFVVVIKREGKEPLIARFGDISLGHVRKATLIDERPIEATRIGRTELIQRLQANRCECCGSDKDLEVHHIRKLSDVNRPGKCEKPLWQLVMSMRKRKTLILCRSCHDDLHAGRPMQWST
jgi:group II intron reverse transcriptase/maturase